MNLDWLQSIGERVLDNFSATFITIIIFTLLFIAFKRFSQKQIEENKAKRVTIQLVFLFIGFACMATLIIVLPIGDTLKGQLFSLIGIVLSAALALSSTTIIGNGLAGLMLNANPQLKLGEFIQVNEHQGRISERGLLHVEIQSEDRNLTTLPNLYLVTHPYRIIHSKGTIIQADLSLGYDLNRKQIETLLKEAAETAGLESPFVQIISLGDFSVSYRIAGVLKEVKHRMTAKTELFKTVLDNLHEHGIEIVSPNFMNTRALNDHKIVPRPFYSEAPENMLPIESIVFDKAEQAESLSAMQEKLQKARDGISKLNQLKKDSPAEQSEALDKRIDNLVRIKDRLKDEVTRMEREKAE